MNNNLQNSDLPEIGDNVLPRSSTVLKRYFTPRQVLWGTVLGGPLAAFIMIIDNNLALGKEISQLKKIIFGIFILVAGVVIAAIVPESLPIVVMPVVFATTAYQYIQKIQMPLINVIPTELILPETNKKVFVLGIVCLACLLFIGCILFIMFPKLFD